MSLSKKFKEYNGDLSFAEWKALYLRLEKARAARGTGARKAVKVAAVKAVTPTFERVAKRVDCMGVHDGMVKIACDKSDSKRVITCLKAVAGGTYTSKRGERQIVFANITNVIAERKLAAAGFTPKGF